MLWLYIAGAVWTVVSCAGTAWELWQQRRRLAKLEEAEREREEAENSTIIRRPKSLQPVPRERTG
jgi:hypothetical protein